MCIWEMHDAHKTDHQRDGDLASDYKELFACLIARRLSTVLRLLTAYDPRFVLSLQTPKTAIVNYYCATTNSCPFVIVCNHL